MANTKNLDRAARRKAKREMRQDNKEKYRQLTDEQRKKLRAFEDGGFKKFLATLEQEKQESAGS